MKELTKFISDKPLQAIAIIAFIILIAYFVVKSVKTSIRQHRIKKMFGTQETVSFEEGEPRNTSKESVVIDYGRIAGGIHDAFYKNDWLGFSEDEEAAINLLLNVPAKNVPMLSQVYATIDGNDLVRDFRQYLTDSQYNSIKSKFSYMGVGAVMDTTNTGSRGGGASGSF